jgi:hypothetical protein
MSTVPALVIDSAAASTYIPWWKYTGLTGRDSGGLSEASTSLAVARQ